MNELALISLVAVVGGGVLGYFMIRTIMKDIGVPTDERAFEIAKLSAVKTLKLVLFVTVAALYYSWLILRDERCTNLATLIFATIFFGNLAFRAYYAKRM
ncbi:DUF2178 domain-containing protein [Thermococcus thioreducens]|uniref:Predicted membrane protein n=1 Tax=Thermococcus thioreducens TaxID=277988 RepID=A0A0Q2MPG8_9EURY|nr:DUF2178 domain-containing protein [Thermococcus thioreducens]ASJ13073.1 hypothetical protein A3L14_09325 [Thermococcus thioreducens]KQH81583.1 hypothetical protein AMR53_10200 [Thermococcus thioreducens]SEV81549.1 Predicted membrane protein [Thermococcus thioreducens]